MYFLYHKSFNAFYGVSGAWVPKEVAKLSPEKLCIFGDSYDAQSCKAKEGLKNNVMILNEKSMRSKMKFKRFPENMQPNWNKGAEGEPETAPEKHDAQPEVHEARTIEGSSQQAPAMPFQMKSIPDKGTPSKKITFCEYLDDLDKNVIMEKGDKTYLQSTLPDEVLKTELIQETVEYLAMTRHIFSLWEARMRTVESDIHHYDLQISDELHFLELISDLSDMDMLNCSKRLQSIRRTRRIAKNERDIGKLLVPMLRTGIDMHKLDTIDRFMTEIQERVYRVRQPDAEVDLDQMEGEEDDEDEASEESPALSIRSPFAGPFPIKDDPEFDDLFTGIPVDVSDPSADDDYLL